MFRGSIIISNSTILAITSSVIASIYSNQADGSPLHHNATFISSDNGIKIPRSSVEIFSSSINEEKYRVYIAWPDMPPPSGGYPVIYFLDGDNSFASNVEIARLMQRRSGISPAVLVGIGYYHERDDIPEFSRHIEKRRAYDYTPSVALSEPVTRKSENGGAERFLRFITNELRPSIERRFKIDRKRQALYGHSYGGLFVLHTLFTAPAAFQTYLASSPSTWYADRLVLKEAEAFARQFPNGDGRRLYVSIGADEQSFTRREMLMGGDAARDRLLRERRMVDGTRAVAGILAPLTRNGFELKSRVLEGEGHTSAKLVLAPEMLSFFLKPRQGGR